MPLVLPGMSPVPTAPEVVVVGPAPPTPDKGGRAVAKTDHQRHAGSATEHRRREAGYRGRPRRRSPQAPPPPPPPDRAVEGIISLLV